MSVALLIPAYNPAARLQDLVRTLAEAGVFSRIVVVDDGSHAASAPVFTAIGALPGVSVLCHAANRGKGAALKSGFAHILESGDETAIVTADADGQHAPADIVRVAQASLAAPEKFILGARAFDTSVPWRSAFGNRLTRLVMRLATGARLTDTQTGLRAWPRRLAVAAGDIASNGYEFEMDALLRALKTLRAGAVVEVPIATLYEDGNRASHFNPLWDSMRIYFVFLRFCGAGLVTALADNLVFITAHALGGSILSSQIRGRAVGALVSFLLSREMVFHSHANGLVAFARFCALVAALGAVSYAMIVFLNTYAGMPVVPAKVLSELTLFVASFTIQRNFIFRR